MGVCKVLSDNSKDPVLKIAKNPGRLGQPSLPFFRKSQSMVLRGQTQTLDGAVCLNRFQPN